MTIQNKIEDFWFRIYRITGRLLIKYSPNSRPTSSPFITGDGFRSITHHIYDDLQKITDPSLVNDFDIVFVGDSLIDAFIANIHPHINAKYTLITHNGDAVVDAHKLGKVNDKIIHWYGINTLVSDPKVTPIPLGIENKHYFVCGIPALFKKIMENTVNKKDKIFYAFTVSTNTTERQRALDEIKKHPLGETLNQWRGFRTYLAHLNHFKFVLSPPGSSVEGHRTWDTLYIGGIPIVKSSVTTDYFKKIGLPLLVLNDWSELEDLDNKTLSNTYQQLKEKEDTKPLYMDYWMKKIVNNET